ncbi:hypothetical protein CARUB_v10017946mg [Capsella rubella]|uniref:Uncharacterized protein n=1 Tax=Capsella rubella TaxID=81985 RepID=R0HL75_9BRAS|nr:uncharacterized protein At3g27210 [Capsella rubella]EOA24673.1 hypothetical protein CARUB_v10017946mg [Capsella rubella]
MGSSPSSLNKSPIRADCMVTPASPITNNDTVSMIVSPSPMKTFESPRKSGSIPAVSPTMKTANNNQTPVKSRWSFSSSKKSFGSKDETFFDSQPWLQSDSDDDFHSVNADFTPSRGNTPKGSFSDRPPRFHNLIFHERKSSLGSSSPAPLPRRKKLGELFRDSIREEREESSEGGGSSSAISTPYLSGANSGEFNNDTKEEKKKSNWQHHRCLPGFSSCGGSFMERRKKMSSETPAVAVE